MFIHFVANISQTEFLGILLHQQLEIFRWIFSWLSFALELKMYIFPLFCLFWDFSKCFFFKFYAFRTANSSMRRFLFSSFLTRLMYTFNNKIIKIAHFKTIAIIWRISKRPNSVSIWFTTLALADNWFPLSTPLYTGSAQ